MKSSTRLTIIILLLHCSWALAQSGSTSGPQGDDYTFQVGNSLISQVPGISEIMPLWGISYSTKFGPGRIEPHYFHASAHGVQYNILGASYRIDQSLDDTTLFGGGGVDIHNYLTPEDKNRKTNYGLHAMGGLMVLMTQAVWFRTELRLYAHPGFNLYYGFGLIVRLPN